MSVDGRWEGKLVDSSGVSARIALSLRTARRRVTGDYSVYFLSEHSGGCADADLGLAQSGPVSGNLNEGSKGVSIAYSIQIGESLARVEVDLALRDAMPHAKQALFGCYSVSAKDSPLTLEGGGVVLWQYA